MFNISDPDTTVLVDLSTQGTAKVFAFPPNEERALTVGSDARAEFRVTGAGVAPVQFHLELQGGTVYLIPAYGLSDLRVNAARVSGPLQLEERNVIEFSEVRIDATVRDGGKRDLAGSDDAWSHHPARISEPPGDGDATQVAMRAITSPTNGVGQQTTSMLRPIDAHAFGPQQTERMAPYRAEAAPPIGTSPMPVQRTERMAPVQRAASNWGPALTAQGTEIMSPVRPNPSGGSDSPPPMLRTQRLAPINAAPLAAAATRPIVPVPVVAVTIVAPAKAEASSRFADPASDSSTTLFEVPAVRTEQRFADSRSLEATPTATDVPSPTPRGWSRDETPGGLAKTRPSTSGAISWLAKLGLLAKARPALVACGATAGAFVLATVLLVATRLVEHRQTRRPPAANTAAARPLTPHRTVIAVAPAPPIPVQIVEAPSTSPSSSATRITPSPVAPKTPNDPELTAAVADVIAGRYTEARAAYAALSQRTGNTATYASLARLLARAEDPACSANGQGAPKDCPGVHR